MVQALGPRLAKYLFLTARPLSAQEALQVGLLHQICPSGELDGLVASCVDDIVQGSPASLPATKALVQTVAHRAVTDQVVAGDHRLHRRLPGARPGAGRYRLRHRWRAPTLDGRP